MTTTTPRFGVSPLLLLAVLTVGCERPPRRLTRPNVIAVDAAGNLFVSDMLNARIVRFDAQGRFLGTIGRRGLGRGRLWRPWGLAALPDGAIAVVNHSLRTLDDPNSFYREVKVFGPDGSERLAFSATPPGEEAVGWPEDILPIPGGFIVADHERNALLFFDRQGTFQRKLHEIDGGPPLTSPCAPRLAGDGSLWLTEYKAHRVRRITLDGRELLRIGREGEGSGEFLFPYSMAISKDGWIAIADLGNFRIERYDWSGRRLGGFAPKPAGPDVQAQLVDLEVTPDGLLWITDSKGGRLLGCRPETGEVVRTISSW